MRSLWLVLLCVTWLSEGKVLADPGIDVSRASSQPAAIDNDNPLAAKKAAPRSTAPSTPPPVDQDAVDLLQSPGSTAEKAYSGSQGSQASDPNADPNFSPDMVNGNVSNNSPIGVPIRRAKRAPDSPAPLVQQPADPDTQLPQKDDEAAAAPADAPQVDTAQVETTPSVQPAPSLAMKLRLNDLVFLQKAAEQAGGSVNVTVSTVGINPEDLIQPLRKQGVFNISIDKNSFLVSSKSDELGQIDSLTTKRRQLLQQISDLQSELAALNQKRDGTSPSSPADTDAAPATAPMPAVTDPSSGKPAELILSTNTH
jgi:hypothetical protein